jgi:hypothetical protein
MEIDHGARWTRVFSRRASGACQAQSTAPRPSTFFARKSHKDAARPKRKGAPMPLKAPRLCTHDDASRRSGAGSRNREGTVMEPTPADSVSRPWPRQIAPRPPPKTPQRRRGRTSTSVRCAANAWIGAIPTPSWPTPTTPPNWSKPANASTRRSRSMRASNAAFPLVGKVSAGGRRKGVTAVLFPDEAPPSPHQSRIRATASP